MYRPGGFSFWLVWGRPLRWEHGPSPRSILLERKSVFVVSRGMSPTMGGGLLVGKETRASGWGAWTQVQGPLLISSVGPSKLLPLSMPRFLICKMEKWWPPASTTCGCWATNWARHLWQFFVPVGVPHGGFRQVGKFESQWTAYLKHERCLDSHLFPHPCLVHILSIALIVFGPNARSTKIYWCNISSTFIHSHGFIFIKRENTDISGHSVDADAREDIFKELFFESMKPRDDLRFWSN